MLSVIRERTTLAALGAFVRLCALDAHAQEPAAAAGTIEGTVYDSLLTHGPLRGATVYVVGTTLTTTSDVRGRFTITGVPDGDHTVTFSHAVFDSTGVQAPLVRVSVAAPATSKVTIATPKGETLIKATCRGPQADQTGLLLGVVRDIDTGNPISGARVVSRWFELTIEKKGPRYQTLETAAVTDAAGVFRLCNLPADIPVFVRARASTQESGRAEIYLMGTDVAFRDFAVSLTDSAAKISADGEGSPDSTLVSHIKGTGVARGIIRDANGQPLPNATVGLLDHAAAATTDAAGRFVLRDVPAGTQTLDVRALGFAPGRHTIVLKPNSPTEVETKLFRAAQKLSAISVIGSRKDGRLTKWGFEERRRKGTGFFMDADDIEKKSGICLGDVLRFAPGMVPNYTSRGRTFTMRSTHTGDRCSPNYYLDGIRWYPLDGNPILELERFMSLNDVAAVEVYTGGAGTPMQFDNGNGCGAVVFWTR